MKKSDKFKYLNKMLEVLESGVRIGLCANIYRVVPESVPLSEYLRFKNFVLGFHKEGLGKDRLLKGVPPPYLYEGAQYRIRLVKRALKSLQAPKKRPVKKVAKKKAAKR